MNATERDGKRGPQLDPVERADRRVENRTGFSVGAEAVVGRPGLAGMAGHWGRGYEQRYWALSLTIQYCNNSVDW